ncbi:MAG: hypothetical protein KUG82_12105 [Pseudomonadales bacterium]|nr:hypothetical protein [Pseudomonadales bacterium]
MKVKRLIGLYLFLFPCWAFAHVEVFSGSDLSLVAYEGSSVIVAGRDCDFLDKGLVDVGSVSCISQINSSNHIVTGGNNDDFSNVAMGVLMRTLWGLVYDNLTPNRASSAESDVESGARVNFQTDLTTVRLKWSLNF